ncbi:MAG: ABC transporter substrate-binding protein, partial [Candidatus Limnocylindrales bacterium]
DAGAGVALDEPSDHRQLRAAAVRRAQARPIWQRRPRLVALAAVALAAIVATTGLLIWKPWQAPALASVAENSVGVIDAGRNEIVAEIPVGTRPGGIAISERHAWVTNTGSDSVTQLGLTSRALVVRIDVGRAPKGIAVADESVWVANSGERTVTRINIAAGRVAQTIEVGNGPTAIAAAGSYVWVANATDSTVVPIDPASGTTGEPVAVAATPIALAGAGNELWVLSEDGASVTHLDATTGVTLAAPIQLPARPSAIALSADSAWVAAADGTVMRIDRATHRLTSTLDVGGRLAAIAVADHAVWVGSTDGTVFRLDPDNAAAQPRRIQTGSAVGSLAVVDGGVWLAAQTSEAAHRGGTLKIVQYNPDSMVRYEMDPLGNPFYNVSLLEGDGLVGYRHVGGTAGSALLADLATSIASPTNGGLMYTFQLRPGLVYSSGAPVLASDFRRGIERSFLVPGFQQAPWGPFLWEPIRGAEGCSLPDFEVPPLCDLGSGIVTDDTARTVTFHLTHADPDFVFRLANPAAYPVPDGVAMNELLVGAFPGTGPYVVTGITDNEVRLGRNPHFAVWDAAVRPDGFPDEIVFTVVESDERRVALVEAGEADLTSYSGLTRTSPDLFARIKTQYAGQWHPGSVTTWFAILNTKLPPFDNLDVRRALNLAVDRAHFAELAGGMPDAAVTCQLLPPTFPGYRPYCPYTLHPDAGGRWKQPDVAAAQALVAVSGTLDVPIVVGPMFPALEPQLDYLADVLRELGYQVSVDRTNILDPSFPGWDDSVQTMLNGWSPDWVAASNFLGLFRCGGDVVVGHCDPQFDAAFDHALEVQATDPAAASAEWAALDRWGVDKALMVPLYNAGAQFVSDRVGNFQFHPSGTVLFDQLWVQ